MLVLGLGFFGCCKCTNLSKKEGGKLSGKPLSLLEIEL